MAAALKSKKKKSVASVRRLPQSGKPPRWLRSLLLTQRVSILVTFGLAGMVLAVYGWTVYTQQLWGKEYSKLEQLRRNERQITANGEVLKNQIATQSNRPDASLVPQNPDSLIFIKAAPPRPEKPVASSSQSSPVAPLGY
ncbi:hypothetical protein H6F89_07480 [Cyanobacteria bacterium FACHB-63]|nr:hypothetical protein [Cyanobacteria bacterium FACHB-63]